MEHWQNVRILWSLSRLYGKGYTLEYVLENYPQYREIVLTRIQQLFDDGYDENIKSTYEDNIPPIPDHVAQFFRGKKDFLGRVM